MDIVLLVLLVTAIMLLIAIFTFFILKTKEKNGGDTQSLLDDQKSAIVGDVATKLDNTKTAMLDEINRNNNSLNNGLTTLITANNDFINKTLNSFRDSQENKFKDLQKSITERIENIDKEVNQSLSNQKVSNAENFADIQRTMIEKFATIEKELAKKLGEVDNEIKTQLDTLRKENQTKLDEMRDVVDNKMQTTLNKRIDSAFELISKQLQEVSKGLGEMTNLTNGVNNLNKIMSNVKTRGIWGEISLKNLLEQILTADQYAEQVVIKERSKEKVDFAVLLPAKKDDEKIYLPIDAKFPLEDYQLLVDASDRFDKEQVENARKNLFKKIKTEAKSISEKYIDVPKTTNFAIMYLPIEGLFAEVVRDTTLLDELQNKYKIVISGPTTITALLNSLQIGFKTLQIQKSSKEVWNALSKFKTEFKKFADSINTMKKQANTVVKSIDETSKRTEKIQDVLNNIETIDYDSTEIQLIGGEDEVDSDN